MANVIEITQPNPGGPLLEQLVPMPTGGGGGGGVFVWPQGPAVAIWVIPHNLGYAPVSVSVMDSTNTEVLVETFFDSINQVTLKFSGPESGVATCSV